MPLQPSGGPITLGSLPVELLLMIISHCPRSRTMSALSRTSRSFHTLLAPTITARFAQRACSIIIWAAINGRMEILDRALAVNNVTTTIVRWTANRKSKHCVIAMRESGGGTRKWFNSHDDVIQWLKDKGVVVKHRKEFVEGFTLEQRQRWKNDLSRRMITSTTGVRESLTPPGR